MLVCLLCFANTQWTMDRNNCAIFYYCHLPNLWSSMDKNCWLRSFLSFVAVNTEICRQQYSLSTDRVQFCLHACWEWFCCGSWHCHSRLLQQSDGSHLHCGPLTDVTGLPRAIFWRVFSTTDIRDWCLSRSSGPTFSCRDWEVGFDSNSCHVCIRVVVIPSNLSRSLLSDR